MFFASAPRPAKSGLFSFSRNRYRVEAPSLTIVPIARGHAGKTACLRTVHAAIRDRLPSGLRLGGGNPLEVASNVERFRQTVRQLTSQGLTQTLAPEVFSLSLQQADATAVTVNIVDVIGQVLTRTTPDSSEEQLDRYAKYQAFLTAADVIWVIASPPSEDNGGALDRWADELMIIRAYLLETIRHKTRPCTVVLALSKADTLFQTEKDLRAKLTSGVLRGLMEPLIDLIEQTSPQRISRCAIFPISSFGFGRAHASANSPSATGNPEEDELEWLLRPNVSVAPFNIVPALLYSIACGLRDKYSELPASKECQSLVRLLEKDLEKLHACYLPIRS